MPTSSRELEALEIIQRYGGQTGYSTVAQAMRVGSEYARTICQGLGDDDYINMTSRGLCKITARGIDELLNRGNITLADLEPADEETNATPQGARGVQAPRSWDTPRSETPQPAAAVAKSPHSILDVKCAYCYGRGVDPFGCPGPTSKCAVCGGKGHNRVVAPYATCTACGGTGKVLGRRLTCTTCKGRGVVAARPGARTRRRSAISTASGTVQRGQVSPISMQRSGQPVPMAERIATHITHFPGVKTAHVEVLLGLSNSEAVEVLQQLVQARKIRQKDDGLYYPA